MDELVNLVSQKTGLSKDQSKAAVDTVIGYLKTRLPPPVAGQIDALLSGGDPSKGLGDVAKGLGGLLGHK